MKLRKRQRNEHLLNHVLCKNDSVAKRINIELWEFPQKYAFDEYHLKHWFEPNNGDKWKLEQIFEFIERKNYLKNIKAKN